MCMPIIFSSDNASSYLNTLYEPEITIPSNYCFVYDVTIPLSESRYAPTPTITGYDVSIDWGDGTVQNNITSPPLFHSYTDDKEKHTVIISGTVDSLSSMNYPGKHEISILKPFKNINTINLSANSFSKVSYVPDDLFVNYPNITSLTGVFQDISQDNVFVQVSENVFSYLSNLENISQCFNKRKLSNSITAKWFESNLELVDCSSVFVSSNVKTVPSNLFKNNRKVTNYSSIFELSEVETVGDSVFWSDVTNFSPDDYLQYIDANNVLGDCVNLRTTGKNLFNFSGPCRCDSSFIRCTMLQNVDVSTFINCPHLLSATQCFANSGLISIPGKLFSNNNECVKFDYTFMNTKIEQIDQDPFDGLTGSTAIDFSGCFSNNKNLRSVTSIFTTLETTVVHNFTDCFSDTALEHCPPLWTTFPNAVGTGCFKNCTSADNYADVPADWK